MSDRVRPHVILLIIGVLLLIVAFLLGKLPNSASWAFTADATKNVAFIVLTVVIVEFLWDTLGGDPSRRAVAELNTNFESVRAAAGLVGDSLTTGLERVYAASSLAGTKQDWMHRLQSATRRVDLMGYTLHVWTESDAFQDVLVRLVQTGVEVNVVMMDPDNPDLRLLVNDEQVENLTVESVQSQIRASLRAFNAVRSKLEGQGSTKNYTVKVLGRGLILAQLCRTDERMTCIQYLSFAVASSTPLFAVHGSNTTLFQKYEAEFKAVWARATPAGLTNR